MRAIQMLIEEMHALGLGNLQRSLENAIEAEAKALAEARIFPRICPTNAQIAVARDEACDLYADDIHGFLAAPRPLSPDDVLIYRRRPMAWAFAEIIRAERDRRLSPELASKVDP